MKTAIKGNRKALGTKSTVLWAEEMQVSARRITDAYGLAPERAVSHRLTTMTPDGAWFACDCGKKFRHVINLERHQHNITHFQDA